jgi:E3 ubiquitin-protein ligase HECTD2
MAPWSSRLLNSNPRIETASNIVPPGPESPTKCGRARLTEADILDNAYGIPTLSNPQNGRPGPSSSSSTKPNSAASHGRSMSHPFPSMFYGKRKGSGAASGEVGGDAIEDDDTSPDKNMGGTKYPKVPDKDLTTGKCMTCNSSVKWPKNLQVFKCTVCLTVNDLVPFTPIFKADAGQKVIGGEKPVAGPNSSRSPNLRGMLCIYFVFEGLYSDFFCSCTTFSGENATACGAVHRLIPAASIKT